MPIIKDTLEGMGNTCKENSRDASGDRLWKMRVGGYDKRKVAYKGWVEIEHFSYRGVEGSFCVMQRDVVRFLSVYLW